MPFIPPVAWGRSFYSSSGSGSLLFYASVGVVFGLIDAGLSQLAWCLVRSILACCSQRGFVPISAGSL